MSEEIQPNAQATIAQIVEQRIESLPVDEREQREVLIQELRAELKHALSCLDNEKLILELVNDSTIDLAFQVAEFEYGKQKYERLVAGRSLPPKPSIDGTVKALQRENVQAEIGRRTEPKLRFELVDDGGTLCWRVLVFDGPKKMPLEQYADANLHAETMTYAQRMLVSRENHEHPDVIVELDDDMTLYDLLGQGAHLEGNPIDQSTWSLLSANFKKGDQVVERAVWPSGGRSRRDCDLAGHVDIYCRLRFAVKGDVIDNH